MIKNLFGGSSEDIVSQYQRAGSEIGVFTLALTGIEDPLDPDPLWDRRYGGRGKVTERVTGNRDFRLQAALDGCRNSYFARDEKGRYREINPVFTDIVMSVPEAAWKADAMRGGKRMEMVAGSLAHLHKDKFRGSLADDRSPIYTVMPDPGLNNDVVVFQFGFGVYVPGGDEILRATISLRRHEEDEPQELPEWSFWRAGGQIKRPVGVYEGQGSVLLAADGSGPIHAPLWFRELGGHILINLNAADAERIYAGDGRIRVLRSNVPDSPTEPADWVLTAGDGDDDTVIIRIAPLASPVKLRETRSEQAVPETARTIKLARRGERAPAKQKKSNRKKARAEKRAARSRAKAAEAAARRASVSESAPAKSPGKRRARRPGGSLRERLGIDRLLAGLRSDTPTEATPLSSMYSLRLAGLGLMRFDGRRAVPGVRRWVIWFDGEGRPLRAGGDEETANALALSASTDHEHLVCRMPGETDFAPLAELPTVLTTAGGQQLELQPSPLPDRYHALLRLGEETSFPLSPKALVLGRSNDNPNSPQPDLPLELLTHPAGLEWYEGAAYAGSRLNALHLSRKHVSLQLEEHGLEVTMAEGTAPVFVLDRDGTPLHTLEPRGPTAATLEPGQMILVGWYLLRFHREMSRVMSSAEHTISHRR
jgi:hypothetical protein